MFVSSMQPESASELEIEIDLLRRIGQGDHRGLEDFYDRISGTLFGIAFRILNNRESAEDVLQEVFVQIWEKAPLYDPSRGKPLTWAVALTRNKAIDRLRSTQRRARLQEDVKKETDNLERIDARSSFDTVSAGEHGKLARDAILRLSDEQREVIELAFIQSLTQSEIAARLGEPLGTIKARIRRGLAKLRELIGPQL
jgi:RNA polymerase sigma-70 factor (ECF subfamily)